MRHEVTRRNFLTLAVAGLASLLPSSKVARLIIDTHIENLDRRSEVPVS
jgi:hypothetical protein